jgi:hypothetical protein
MTRSFDVKLDGEPYNFGARGGLKLGRSITSPSPALQVGTIEIPSFHHGPGQVWGRNPQQFLRASRVDTSREGLLLPAGDTAKRLDGSTADFDDLHGAAFCQVNSRVFLITPNRIYEMDHGGNAWNSVHTPPAGDRLTGSWARWRGQIIFGVEKAPAAALGGDGSDRYAESSPVVYNIATNAFFGGLAVPQYAASHVVSAKGSIWWIQNRGLFAAPRLYWSDDSETNFGSFGAGRLYGPFDIEMGGYCTWLYMAGPHILIFKRNGSIVGVDESKLWTSYTTERGPVGDDLFGHGTTQYLNTLVFKSEQGALAFNPGNLGLDSIEPSRVQPYMALADLSLMGLTTAFTTRSSELFAFGRSPNGCVMYVGSRYGEVGFRFASDYGIYAVPSAAAQLSTGVFRLRKAAGGSQLRPTTGGTRTLRQLAAGEVFDETPIAATVYRHTGPEHYHIFVAHKVDTTNKCRVYQIDLADPAWRTGPATVVAGNLYSSRLLGVGKGVSQLPLQIRGYASFSAAPEGAITEPAAAAPFRVDLAVEENQFSTIGTAVNSGMYVLPMPPGVSGQPGRFFRLRLDTPANLNFRLELPIYLDVLFAHESVGTADHVTLIVTVGDIADNLGNTVLRDSPHNAVEHLVALENTGIPLEFHWGSTWQVFVEKVEAIQASMEHSEQVEPGQYIVTLECRRL